jgi:hypothetical protein
MTTGTPPYKARERRVILTARTPQVNPPERIQAMLDNAERLIAQPFKGLTTDGNVVTGLFPIEKTGVSTAPLKAAAEAFLATLSDEQRETVAFEIDSEQWRRWNNTHIYLMRHGLLMEELDDAQREAALGLVREGLSAAGFELARDIMRLNHTIGEITESWDEYGEWVYYISLFGTPSETEPWGFQYDGHHLIINYFILGDQVVMTPAFWGSEPVKAEGGKYAGVEVLQEEQDRGLRLAQTLTPEQREQAVLVDSIMPGEVPPGRFHGADGHLDAGAFLDNEIMPYEGIRADALSEEQRELLLELIGTYVGRMRDGHSQVKMSEVRDHLDETYFMWLGGVSDDAVFYYRIHSPVILIEFDHQRGVALDIDHPTRAHIHTVVRTPNGNDYGADLLRQHYELHHKDGSTHH